ncbi:MAG: CoF synthetase [Xenophilus sp.]
MRLVGLLSSYVRTRRLRFGDRAALEAHQARQWQLHAARTLRHSPYFSAWVGQPLHAWPTMDKAWMMRHFDAMNTAGLRLEQVLHCAHESERTRDFRPRMGAFSVGLSSGTLGGRGVFVVSPEEQAQWAGVILARLLPRGLLRRERVALFLRANNNLYRTVRTPWLNFSFFDLFEPLEAYVDALQRLQPTRVVAPAQVLRAIALLQRDGRIRLRPQGVVSVAEVLEPRDRQLLVDVFGRVDEVYQATEGFLGSTCEQGALHLNEEFLHVEPQWLDADRFVPLITDFTRRTQPIVRYRLDDVLVRRGTPCGCGRPTMVLDRIEGRCDDMLRLPARTGGSIPVFADVIHRALAQVLPMTADYRLTQTGPASLELWTDAAQAGSRAQAQQHLSRVLGGLGVDLAVLAWPAPAGAPATDFMTKRRRVRRLCQEA